MKRYQIAYFMTDNDTLLSETIYKAVMGCCKKQREAGSEIDISVFTCFGGVTLRGSGQGEYEIVHLPELADYDGIILHASRFQMPAVLDMVVRKLYDSDNLAPVVSIDLPIKGANFVGIDNYAAMKEICEHIIMDKGARRVGFIGGPLDNREAYERMRAFEDVCDEAGIPEANRLFYDGNWSFESGTYVMEELLRERARLPDALIFANDDMALGAAFVCEDNGVRIPEDMMISGFDDTVGSNIFNTKLTTVNRNIDLVVDSAITQIIKRLNRQMVQPRTFIPHRLIFRESTGTKTDESIYGMQYFRRMYKEELRGIHPENFSLTDLISRMFETKRLRDLMGLIEDNSGLFMAERMYLCLNDTFVRTFGEPDAPRSVHFGKKMRMMVCSPERLPRDDYHTYTIFPRAKLLPDEIDRSGSMLRYYPLHYAEYCFGYIAMEQSEGQLANHQQKMALIMIASAIEHLHKRRQMKALNRDLEHLYVKDALTGVYNRFGLDNEGEQLFERLIKGTEEIFLYFFDIDHMKAVNDTYGHDIGDTCINQAAGILERGVIQIGAEENTFIMRFSGDEFVVFGIGLGESFEKAVEDGVSMMNNESFTPFTLSLSYEREVVDRGSRREIMDYIKRARGRLEQRTKEAGGNASSLRPLPGRSFAV